MLSEQQLIDCSTSQGSQGCMGGSPDNAFDYIKAAGGVQTEDTYPYKGVDGQCKADKSQFVVGS